MSLSTKLRICFKIGVLRTPRPKFLQSHAHEVKVEICFKKEVPLVCIVVPFSGLSVVIFRILYVNPKKELQWRLVGTSKEYRINPKS